MKAKDSLTFPAEVIETKSKKTASLDVMYRVVLQSGDVSAHKWFADIEGDQLIEVTVRRLGDGKNA